MNPSASVNVALQTDDSSSDAIIITTIQDPPFATHAELLRMDRAALMHAAQFLNARLPAALQIDVAESRTDAYVRNAIEVLVGLRVHARPGAGMDQGGQNMIEKAAKADKGDKRRKRPEYRRTVSVDLGEIKQQQEQLIFSSARPSSSNNNNSGNTTAFAIPSGPAPRTPTRPRYQRSRSHDTLVSSDRPSFGVGFYVPGAPIGARLEILQEASEDEDTGDANAMDVDEDGAEAMVLGHQQRPQKKRRTRSPVALVPPASSAAASTTVITATVSGVGVGTMPLVFSNSAEFSFDPFRVESPTPAARTCGLHRRMASFDEGRLHELQVLEGHAATRLFRSSSDRQPRLNMLKRPAPTRAASAGAIDVGGAVNSGTASMNGRRKRYQPKERLGRTSTPKKQKTDENAHRGLRSTPTTHDAHDGSDIEMASPSKPMDIADLKPSSSLPSSERVALAALGASRKRKAGDFDSEGDFTFGIDGLSISLALSRNSGLMDLCR
jgi:hypothetical protein